MVLIVYKKSEKNQFNMECPGDTLVLELLQKIIKINNIRIYLDRLIWSVEELANKGVLKPSELQGVSWEEFDKNQKEFQHLPEQIRQYGKKPLPEPNYKYVADKHNQRYGIVLPDEQRKKLNQAVINAKKVMEPTKELASIDLIVEAIEGIREAVMEGYPAYMGLPQWQPALLLLQEKLELQVLETDNYEMFDEKASVWWAGKELESDKPISYYAGKNEKTKLIVKVQKLGGQQPLREPPIDPQTYNKMVKYYYKKVEETKQFEKKSVQSHYDKLQNKSLKAKLHMEGEQIRFKPF